MANYWLFKSEPDSNGPGTSRSPRARPASSGTGVRNYQARNNMRAMKLGDRGFFYHSNEGLAVVGIVEVCTLAHHELHGGLRTLGMRRHPRRKDVPRPVSLDEIKANPGSRTWCW